MPIGILELRAAVTAAVQIEEAIKQKYPAYKGGLVLSTPQGQIEADASVEQILNAFPAMILDSACKAECQGLRAAIGQLEDTADTADPARAANGEGEVGRLTEAAVEYRG